MTERGSSAELGEDIELLAISSSTDLEPKVTAWLPEIPVQFVTSIEGAYDKFGDATKVICLFGTPQNDEIAAFRRDVLTWLPSCQFVWVVPKGSDPLQTSNYNAVLQGPVSKDTFQDAIHERVMCATYSMLLHEYYVMNMHAVAVRKASESPEDAVSDRLVDHLGEIREQLERLKSEISIEDIREISNNLHDRKDFSNQPMKERSEARASKYYPEACPECELAWGKDHGNDLGRGFETLGAGVRKCTRCEELIHELHDSNKGVTKM